MKSVLGLMLLSIVFSTTMAQAANDKYECTYGITTEGYPGNPHFSISKTESVTVTKGSKIYFPNIATVTGAPVAFFIAHWGTDQLPERIVVGFKFADPNYRDRVLNYGTPNQRVVGTKRMTGNVPTFTASDYRMICNPN